MFSTVLSTNMRQINCQFFDSRNKISAESQHNSPNQKGIIPSSLVIPFKKRHISSQNCTSHPNSHTRTYIENYNHPIQPSAVAQSVYFHKNDAKGRFWLLIIKGFSQKWTTRQTLCSPIRILLIVRAEFDRRETVAAACLPKQPAKGVRASIYQCR